MRRKRRTGYLVLIGLLGLLLLTAIYVVDVNTPDVYPSPSTVVVSGRIAVWMPSSWDGARARASWSAHRSQIDELSPVWYQLDARADGSILPYTGACDATLADEARANGTLLIPLINNAYGGVFDPAPVSAVIGDPALRAAHVAALVSEVVACGYDGIDLDYESLSGQADREPFSLLVEELAAALHAEGRLLVVTVHPKTEEPGGWAALQAQDWARIGAAADRFRVMTYGYHWSGSAPGPIAPLFWMEEVIAFATSLVPAERVYMGIHLYGLDWGAGSATPLVWERAQELLSRPGVNRSWEARDRWGRPVGEPQFTYSTGEGVRRVWYADSASVAERLRLAERRGLGGVAIWRLGGEDPGIWSTMIREHVSSRNNSHQ